MWALVVGEEQLHDLLFNSHPWKSTPIPIEWKAGWSWRWFEYFGEKKSFLTKPGIKPPIVQPLAVVTIQTELSAVQG
jgi:hypothetical protein